MNQQKQRVLTGFRPSGKIHLGNYFAAIKTALSFQDSHELFLFIANLHALNTNYNGSEIKEFSLDLIATLLACGLDISKTYLYLQSLIPQISQLAWILSCITPYSLMLRAHSFKDAQAKGLDVNMGIFNYPILMAADILIFDAELVPVGKDQKQHLEMARDIAQKFNNQYGDTFVLPEALISPNISVIPGTDGEKMSKSKNNIIPLFGSDKVWKNAIMSIKTDSKGLNDPKDPDNCVVFKLFTLLASKAEIEEMRSKYIKGGFGYGHAKLELFKKMQEVFGAMRDKYFELIQDKSYLMDILYFNLNKLLQLSEHKIQMVYDKVGLLSIRQ